MSNEFTLTETINAKAEDIYKAWISTDGHTALTGSPANVDNGKFTAWDGYISGMFLELDESKRVLMNWRTAEFPEDAEDSKVEVLLEEEIASGSALATTKVTLKHWNIPEGQADSYKQGWDDFYFKPMKTFFK